MITTTHDQGDPFGNAQALNHRFSAGQVIGYFNSSFKGFGCPETYNLHTQQRQVADARHPRQNGTIGYKGHQTKLIQLLIDSFLVLDTFYEGTALLMIYIFPHQSLFNNLWNLLAQHCSGLFPKDPSACCRQAYLQTSFHPIFRDNRSGTYQNLLLARINKYESTLSRTFFW